MLVVLALLTAVVCGGATFELAVAHSAEASRSLATERSEGPTVAVPTPTAIASRPPVAAIPLPDEPPPMSPPLTEAPGPTPSGVAQADPSLEPELILLGTLTVTYVVGPANGNGANVVIPLDRLDGQVVEPGASFEFWTAVGEVSRRTGYRRGGLITGHRVDPDGALAGGICTVSTALFNAAARAGLPITARTSHRGYLAKYPLGLDAAVAKGDGVRQTLAFRNDTPEPILIRTVSTPGTARVDLYGRVPLGRTVRFSEPSISHRVRAYDRHVATRTLARGQHRRIGDRSDGMTVVVRRTVRDARGEVLRRDRWVSEYGWLEGVVLDGTG